MTALTAGTIVIVAVLALTSEGHDIAAAIQRFMLFYAGVFALIGLTGSVVAGLIATDRVILTPGHRVLAQAVHRAVSFGALAFLIVHIVTEILAQRVHVIDAFVPFMSPFRTFYIGLGTIASDLILAQVVTSIARKRFTAEGKAWRWRAIHYTAYVSFLFGILHGLMAGRSAKPYVDWSYGFCIALVAFGVAVRFFAISLRSKDKLSAPPAGNSTSASRIAALHMMQAQAGGIIQMLPPQHMQVQQMRVQALPQVPEYAQPAMAGLPAPQRQPRYEPGYLGPPRYEGVPRSATGPLPQVVGAPVAPYDSGPLPRIDTGPFPRAANGAYPGANTGSFPRADTGPMSRVGTGPIPRVDTGPIPRVSTGPMPRVDTGPIPRVETGPFPRVSTGPFPRVGSRPMPRVDTGPFPPVDTGPFPRVDTGPSPRVDTGPSPRVDTGPSPRVDTGPIPRVASGPLPREAAGPIPRAGSGPSPRAGAARGRRRAGQPTWSDPGPMPPAPARDDRDRQGRDDRDRQGRDGRHRGERQRPLRGQRPSPGVDGWQ